MTRTLPFLALASLVGCAQDPAPREGDTLLRARVASESPALAVSGQLVTLETAFEPCDEGTIAGAGLTLDLTGDSVESIDLPATTLCGIRLVVKDLILDLDDDGVTKTLVGQDFDLWVPADSVPTGSTLDLVLGDADWATELAALAPEGITQLHSDADPVLAAAFYDGIDRGSSFEAQETLY